MQNRSVPYFCSWPLFLLLISLGFAFCLLFCVHLFLFLVNHRHNHDKYNLSPGKWGLTKHLTGCMHHSQENVCPFTLAFKILLLVWNLWDWERNKSRALSVEYHYGLQALIYLSGDQSCCCLGFCIISSGMHINSPFFSYWGEEIKLFCPPGIWFFTLVCRLFFPLVNKGWRFECAVLWCRIAQLDCSNAELHAHGNCTLETRLLPPGVYWNSLCLLRCFPCKVTVLLFPSPSPYHSSDSAFLFYAFDSNNAITWFCFSHTASVLVLSTLTLLR